MNKSRNERSRKPQAFWLFFPAASLLATIAVPLSVWAVWSGTGFPAGLLGAGHGHELIFGFALALIAGYTLGPQLASVLYPLFGLWLAARLSWIFFPDTLIAQLLGPAFALLLAWHVAPRFNAAKKWRNRMVGPLILLICLLAVAFWLSAEQGILNFSWLPGPFKLMHSAITGLLLLMTFMGGRIIAPAVAGTLEKKGIPLEARVQPRIEGMLIVVLGCAVFLVAFPIANAVTGSLLVIGSGLITLRALRWKLWLCPERPDLLVLGVGYLWLAVGAAAIGLALLRETALAPALHLITIGALGTLSTSVMLRLAWQRSYRKPPAAGEVFPIAAILSGSAISRFFAGESPFAEPSLLWLSASLWALAYLWVTARLCILGQHAHNRRK
ncbi:NnrS family protein [Marinobacter sp. 1_MG-2023]|uniref:NnrS family protein n=1 Tax=Marinobacter sp. 1_MG-2023 TaxID=3062627 RepID=UPI0026E415F2|nr:NnrS family protein [Marinobacter sp. 1_MG-2023]MDO6822730.1 NnrS family protein [Marinobacter sp. 1_MG-2023]